MHNLERDGEIICSREGGYARLYPAGIENQARSLYSVLHSRSTRQVLRTLVNGGQMANTEIADATGLPRSTVSEHLELLRQSGLVRRNPTLGGGTNYEVQDQARIGEALALFERNLLAVVADSFIDLWGF